jgi:hypothetical protein
VREWRRPMLRAHTDWILRMRPLGPPDEGCTDENHRGWDQPPDDEPSWSETNHYGYTEGVEGETR